MKARLQEHYEQEVRPKLSPEAPPRVVKVLVNTGVSEDQHQDQALTSMGQQLAIITGQKPIVRRAKKSIAEFKIRAGDPIGLTVTLRGRRMYQFLDKLINLVLPQIKDFQGLQPTGFDGHGNFTLGLKEQIVFPELSYDTIDKIRGLEITLVTSAINDQEGRKLLELLGIPFMKPGGFKHGQEK